MTTLDALCQAHGHIVAEVIEAKLAVGTIGNIGRIGFPAGDHSQLMLVLMGRFFFQIHQEGLFAILCAGSHLQHAHAHTQHVIERGHPTGVTTGQVVIDGDQVYALAG